MAPPKRGLSHSVAKRSKSCLALLKGQHHGIDADADDGEALGRQVAPLVAPITAREMLCGPCSEPLIAFVAEHRVRDLAMECSALTHGHPTGQEAAAAWALILRSLADGDGLEQAAATHAHSFGAETRDAILRGLQTPADGRPETTEQLGGGWTAEEALSIAIHACRCARDLEHGLIVAVTHSGDSDSTGAIAGNALGLMFPGQARSHRWAAQVECRDLIGRMAMDLAMAMSGEMDDLVTRYPGALRMEDNRTPIDAPRSLNSLTAIATRRAMLDLPHMAPLTAYAAKLRARNIGTAPDFDPVDGGTDARLLFLMEKPGPMTDDRAPTGKIGAGSISRDNDDPTAEAVFNFMRQVRIPREDTVLWNVIPWWNGTRNITPSSICCPSSQL
ncbi:ADP-ribosylglycohydrolase family protein [Paracoccus sp. PAMC 22219]|uniref:ADP-ribosylglycohydrolase family protein n=1 Tax=Paracoccus sp. PAMC 22219 TaxID=1569209 RepID=UPI00069888CB|nr:ADP-ribosylglycohydrolase family protein [Paracoccus sp. PAMC 22219]